MGEAAVLVGDPARIGRMAAHLEQPVLLDEHRGLRTVTGWSNGRRISATAFGMGALIATVVLHELHQLGVRSFLRIGTAMVAPPATLGDFVPADAALRADGTSDSYAPRGYPASADHDTAAALPRQLGRCGRPWQAGVFATCDGFYTHMFSLDASGRFAADGFRDDLRRCRILAGDMETASLFAAAEALMFEIALDTLAEPPPPA